MKRITQIYILIFLHPYIIRVNTQNKQPICDIYSCKGTENENEESDYNHRVKYNVPTYCSQRTKIRTPNSTSTPFNYTLTPCNNNSQCIISLTTDRSTCTEEPAPPNSKYPGERCTSSLSCIWGTCTDHICISGNIYTPCTADVECNVGLYCHNNTGTCMGWKLVNQYCDIYTKCASYLICDLNLCCVVGGKNVGEIAYSPLACATLYTSPVDAAYTYTYIVGGYGHITYYCANGPYLIGYNATVPLPCPYSGLCEYNLTMGARSTVVYRDCQCGITQKGESYCPLGMGDMAQEINDVMIYIYIYIYIYSTLYIYRQSPCAIYHTQ